MRVRKLSPQGESPLQGLEREISYCENTKKPATSFPSFDPNNLSIPLLKSNKPFLCLLFAIMKNNANVIVCGNKETPFAKGQLYISICILHIYVGAELS